VLLGLAVGLTVPIFEELGWTGFAIPKLLPRYGVLGTGLIMGGCGGIEPPLFAGNASASGGIPPTLLRARSCSPGSCRTGC
jgi:hypothetical protein